MTLNQDFPLAVSATNIHGLGATQVVKSLLPALARAHAGFDRAWVPAGEGWALPELVAAGVEIRQYARRLPNAMSRVAECLLAGNHVSDGRALLTLGDLPYRTSTRQVVFVQTPFLVRGSRSASMATNVKSAVSRAVFLANLPNVHRIIVQTSAMRDGLASSYPQLCDRIVVIAQPPPQWLVGASQPRRARTPGEALRLVYPASPYAHKNHAVLAPALACGDAIATIATTLPADHPAASHPAIAAHGVLDALGMRALYQAGDALVFPSLEESYGLPLVEAMVLGMPILVADRPYAHALCGLEEHGGAIYFDPRDPAGLARAAERLRSRLDAGWRPDWRRALDAIPRDWDAVARRMLATFQD